MTSHKTLIEPPLGKSHLRYKEDMLKTNQAGLNKQRSFQRKLTITVMRKISLNVSSGYTNFIIHFVLQIILTMHFILLHSCILKSVGQEIPSGDNKLANVAPRLMKSAVIEGYFTNHSLVPLQLQECMKLISMRLQ